VLDSEHVLEAAFPVEMLEQGFFLLDYGLCHAQREGCSTVKSERLDLYT